jgi:hypothetical protein
MKKQTYTSAGTSINSVKLPAIYSKVKFTEGTKVLDYGCGRYTDHLKAHVEGFNAEWFGYDPFNYPTDINGMTFDTVLCSNVMNVIDSEDVLYSIGKTLAEHTEKVCYITIYEGDKSGIGRATKSDCYQRNERTNEYAKYLEKCFSSVTVKNGMIIASK